MVPIPWRNLFEDKLRLSISAAGVALSIMLVLLLDGFFTGMSRQVTAFVDNTPANYFVSQKGVANMFGGGSVIPKATLQEVEAVKGVKSAMPLLTQYVILEMHGKKVTTFMIGYDPARGGGPWRLSSGRAVASANEIVVDQVLARRHGLKLGDDLEVLGQTFHIVGLSAGTSSWMVGLIFVQHDAAAALLRAKDTTSSILVAADGDQAVLQRLKEALPNLSVVPRETVARNDEKFLTGVFSIPLRMMVGIAIAIGALLIGLTIYSATVERVREYGVLKAIGMRNLLLYSIVTRQAMGATAIGFVAGLALVWVVAGLIQAAWPQFFVAVDRGSVIQAAVGAVIMALLASLLPARYVANIDPARIFRH